MNNNSDGLSPSLRSQLGVGWNRVLPAPFGFDNGLFPDGVNDYIDIPSFVGKNFPTPFTLQFWSNGSLPVFVVYNNSNVQTFTTYPTATTMLTRIRSGLVGAPFDRQISAFDLISSRFMYTIRYDGLTTILCTISYAGNYNYNTGVTAPNSIQPLIFPQSIQGFRLGYSSSGAGNGPGTAYSVPIDEFRMFNKYLTDGEIYQNYNDGLGNNPSITENLLIWYKFQEFENLDFSALQDNSDIRLGVRDLSGLNNHGQPMNMDTTLASPTYVLKPF